MTQTRPQMLEEKGVIDHMRGRDFYDPTTSSTNVVVAGCGGIGSATALCLSKMGIPYLTLIDDDIIEAHNTPNQFFSIDQTGKDKVEALKEICEAFGSSEVTTHKAKVEECADELRGIVVTGFDNMVARHRTWQAVRLNADVDRLVCARIGAFDIVIYTIDPKDPDDIQMYEDFALFPDDKGLELPCTGQVTIDVAFQVASQLGRIVRMLATGQHPKKMITINQETLEVWQSTK